MVAILFCLLDMAGSLKKVPKCILYELVMYHGREINAVIHST